MTMVFPLCSLFLHGSLVCGKRSCRRSVDERWAAVKIAIASVRKDENPQISPRPGRARFYLLYNGEGALLEVISNPFSRGGGGAGFGVAKMLADKGVRIVIGGTFGGKMEEALKSRGVKYQEMCATVREGIQRAIENENKGA
jgi:predicted Fe-Mo cluster-binding NifX family protein